ncbi:MAG: hypothetical protein APG09_01571 [Candidatus Methanofastidiosum methylothiophilum]|jgi:hypothetical protein|uniref:Uncharacterized protein n=1 Tax=Candidatus Methanofastidiosum methylothiophilum TaxID=1705564 RepID=A0A150JFQ6_9EURY|nr:MAG: hypothetical protein APG09_01571 [Candidatus Methanofastidiosum methylthiophilus]
MITAFYGTTEITNLREMKETVSTKQVFITVESLSQIAFNPGEALVIKEDETVLFDKTIINISTTKDFLKHITFLIMQY